MSAFLLLWLGLFAPEPALDPEVKAQLYPVLQRAYRLFEARRFDAAVDAFERAYAISPEPRFVLNVAISHGEAGRCALSLATYERFFRVCSGCRESESARALSVEQRERCEAPVRVETSPPGATVYVDGVRRGTAPLELRLPEGPHVVGAATRDHAPVEQPIIVEGGEPADINLVMTSTAAPEPAPVDLRPWAWGAFAVAGVGAVTGGVFGALLLDDLEQEAAAGTRDASDAARDHARRDAALAQVGLGLALAGAATGVALLMLDESVALLPAPGGVGVVVRY